MIAFTDTFKLYMRDSHKHKLSIRVTDCVCDTYLLDNEHLAALCTQWSLNREGTTLQVDGNDWFVQHKKIGTANEYVRISIWHQGMCRDYRVLAGEMRKLSAQWQLHQTLSILD
jgi:hypothetical protein